MKSIGTESNVEIIEERKEKLLAKLEKRNEERKSANSDSNLKNEETEMEYLMKEIREDLEKNLVDNEKIQRLQSFPVVSMGNRRFRTLQSLLEDVRKFKVSQKPVAKFSGFSFSKRKESTMTKNKGIILTPTTSKNSRQSENVVENLRDKVDVISGKDMEDITLKNIEKCRLEFNFKPSVVHIRNIKNSTLLFLQCDRSILMHDCENIHLYVAAQQIRVHTSIGIHLHVATRGAVILEESTDVFMSPYRLKFADGREVTAEDNGEWRIPRDFDWLAENQSPNWKIVEENLWCEEQLSF